MSLVSAQIAVFFLMVSAVFLVISLVFLIKSDLASRDYWRLVRQQREERIRWLEDQIRRMEETRHG